VIIPAPLALLTASAYHASPETSSKDDGFVLFMEKAEATSFVNSALVM
jgi:hypothetical protein